MCKEVAPGLTDEGSKCFPFFDPLSSDVFCLSVLRLLFISKDRKKGFLRVCFYLISLFANKIFLRNQPTDFPLHFGGHNWVAGPSLGKQEFVIFVSYREKRDFLTKKKGMGMTVSRHSIVSSVAVLKNV